jgi:uncharacterized protein YdhG (YjbR/CyaY superfamily)
MPDKPTTVTKYLASIPVDRRKTIKALRETIKKNLDPKLKEGIQYNAIGYFLPHSVYPDGYHCDPKEPLPFVGLASQKNHIGIYLFCLYTDESQVEQFQKEWKATGKRLDMGKSCVRIRTLDDVPLDVLGRAIKRITAAKFVKSYEAIIPASKRKKASKKKVAKKK